MRPYPKSKISDRIGRQIFNYRLSRARRVVENTFGILAQIFRIYHKRLKLHPRYATNIILTTCVLHNYIRQNMSSLHSEEGTIKTPLAVQNFAKFGENASTLDFRIRQKYTKYFNSTHVFHGN
ncbi:hypothetical protein NQ314_009291 [Rhamnusium bicolor]|uniref:DDE Tnp4 domain-containing protein n=1 Tax=Rhamnusium bicolor TaxID=1586634 RepID=A0AAV8Y3P9_9CUCU|nr:hypothetical protein NQ314_009291 [Rhamnusium bicolor]